MFLDVPLTAEHLVPLVGAFLFGYLLGSIPSGLILTRLGGAGDLRQIGSGNIGATNVLRTGRKGLAAATLAFDLVKGALPVWLAYRFFGPDMAMLAGLGAVLGHCFPIWLGFKGGKGVATAAGIILALSPATLGIALLVFLALVLPTKYVSLGSLGAAIAAPITAYFLGHVQAAELFLLVAIVVFIKHRANIPRLIRGEENKTSLGKR